MASVSLHQVKFLSYVDLKKSDLVIFLLCDLVFDIVIWDLKVHTSLVIDPPTQSLGACFALHVWRPRFILVTKLNAKIAIVSIFY